MLRQAAIPAGCLLLVVVCYGTSLPNAFLLDDVHLVAQNERIRHIRPFENLTAPYWEGRQQDGLYRPLTVFTYSIEYPLWGLWPPGYRATNLTLHAINGWLVYLLACEFLAPAAAAVGAAVYLAHPAHTEAVVFIIGRNELLAATMLFSAWLLFRRRRYGWACLAYVLAMFSKENAVILPALIVLDIWISGHGSFRPVIQAWPRLALMAAAAAAYLILRVLVLGRIGVPAAGQYLAGAWTLTERWMTSGRAYLEYFRLYFAPVTVVGDYGPKSIGLAGLPDWDAWLGLALVGGAAGLGLWLRRRQPVLSLAILFFFTALLPVSNWVFPIGSLLAERFLYVPLFSAGLLVGWLFQRVPPSRVRTIAVAGLLAAAVILCNSHNLIWQDALTFYGNMTRVLPGNLKGRIGFGSALVQIGKFNEAEEQFKAGLALSPDHPAMLAALAANYLARDRQCGNAYPFLMRAVDVDPREPYTLWLLGDCKAMERRMAEAEAFYRRAVDSASTPDPRLLVAWSATLEATGRSLEARHVLARAALLDPDITTGPPDAVPPLKN